MGNNFTKIMNDIKENKIKYSVIGLLFIALVVCLFLLFGRTLNNDVEYIVSFDSNGGSYVEPIIVKEGEKAIKPADPTKEGFSFAGWYYNDELYDFNTLVTKNIVLKAQWGKGETTILGITLDTTNVELYVGDTYEFKATITPSDATSQTLIWESSDSNVVTVDSNGKVTAIGAGTATISVKDQKGEYTAKATVVVKEKTPSTPIEVTGVSLNKSSLSLNPGGTYKLVATVKPSNATNKNVTWKSSDTSVVKVDSNGKITALKVGKATITVTTKDGQYIATCNVTVKAKADSYSVVFTPIVQEVTGAINQYSMSVSKNSNSFSDFSFVIYNNTKITNGHYLSVVKYNDSVTSATIRLKDGSDITAKVIYK